MEKLAPPKYCCFSCRHFKKDTCKDCGIGRCLWESYDAAYKHNKERSENGDCAKREGCPVNKKGWEAERQKPKKEME